MVGKVISVYGTVLVRKGERADSYPLKAGTFFHSSDVINTSSDGGVKLLFDDKTIVDLGPSSLFRVNEYKANTGNDRQVDLNLPYGNFRVAVAKPIAGKGKFTIKTKTATMGVRGTVFGGSASEHGLQMTTQSGAVAVTSGGGGAARTVLIPANTGMSVSSAGQASVEKVTTSVANARMARTEVRPATFAANVTFNKNSAISTHPGSGSKSGDKGGEKSSDKGGDKSGEKSGEKSASGGTGESGAPNESGGSGDKSSDGSADRAPATADASGGSSGSGSAPEAASTASLVSNIVMSDTSAAMTATATALPVLSNIAPPKPAVIGPTVVVPVGGLKQVTIQVTR